MMKWHILTFALLATGLLSWGCIDTNIKIPDGYPYPRPVIIPLPITVGAYYKESFKGYHTTEEPGNIIINNSGKVIYSDLYNATTIDMGQVNTEFFNYVLDHAFDEVLLVDSIPSDLSSVEGMDVIIEPNIRDYDADFVQEGLRSECNVQITYIVNLHLPESGRIAPWIIIGYGATTDFLILETGIKDATHLALRDVAARFFTRFCNQNEIKSLFLEECRQ